jgi:hypothetical protein
MNNEEDLKDLVKDIAVEGKRLVDALNATTGCSPENPNPLTKRMLRLIGDAEHMMETEDE